MSEHTCYPGPFTPGPAAEPGDAERCEAYNHGWRSGYAQAVRDMQRRADRPMEVIGSETRSIPCDFPGCDREAAGYVGVRSDKVACSVDHARRMPTREEPPR